MRELLQLLRGARLLRRGQDGDRKITHWLLPDGRVLEIVG